MRPTKVTEELLHINPEKSIGSSKEVDIGIHLFYHEFKTGDIVQPYNANLQEYLKSSSVPLIAMTPKSKTQETMHKLSELNRPTIIAETPDHGLYMHTPDISKSYKEMISYISSTINPNQINVFGEYIFHPLAFDGCVGKVYCEIDDVFSGNVDILPQTTLWQHPKRLKFQLKPEYAMDTLDKFIEEKST